LKIARPNYDHATTQFANPDPGIKFTTQQDEIDLLNSLVTTTISTDVTTYVIGSSTPSVDDQDKVWYRLNANGGPNGVYTYYKGLWVRIPPLPAQTTQLYYGDPTLDFDANGKGLAGAGPVAKDFMGWALLTETTAQQTSPTDSLLERRMDNVGITGYDAGTNTWRTNIRGLAEASGGVSTIKTDVNTTYRAARSDLKAAKYSADGNVQGGALWGDPNGSTDFTALTGDVGNLTPLAISVVNPFFAMAYVGWIGYDSY
jgi:hypothetical protein